MANGDDLDPGDYNAPAGAGTAMGMGAGNPLYDWYSQLKPDDLANLLHNPQSTAADLSARGVDVPPIDQIHAANRSMGTPSDSSRFDTTPASSFESPLAKSDRLPLYGAVQSALPPGFSPQGSQAPGTAFAPGDAPPPRPEDTAGRPSDRRPVPETRTIGPSGPLVDQTKPDSTRPLTPEDLKPKPGSIAQRIIDALPRKSGAVAAPADRTAPAPSGTTNPWGANAPGIIPQAPEVAPAPVAAAAGTPESRKEAPKPTTTEEKVQKAGEALSDLGKAMQGVKAPEPLRPPAIGAPTVKGTQHSGAPNIASLLQAMSRTSTGQVPPSALPSLLRMLGRG